MHLLAPLGLGQVENDVYLALLDLGQGTVDDIAARASVTAAAVRPALPVLVSAGLVFRLGPDRYLPVAPEVSVAALVARRRGELAELQVRIEDLVARQQAAAEPTECPIELVEGENEVVGTLASVQLAAKDEVLIIDSPPYLGGQASPNDIQVQRMADGVVYRVVYSSDSLSTAEQVEHMHLCVAAGERARVLPHVRTKLVVVDSRVAVLPVSFEPMDPSRRLVVRSQALVTVLIGYFESLWDRAEPVSVGPAGDDGVTARDREMLTLLAAGMKDVAIARTLGVTDRTVGRRLTELMRVLGAGTRFQAGVLAARRGWL